MNQQVATTQSSPEAEAFAKGMAQFQDLSRRAKYYEDLSYQWEEAAKRVEVENAMLKRQVKDLDHKLGYYMRHSTELKTGLETVVGIIDGVLQKARQGAYAPNGAAPESSPPDPLQVPSFLTAGPRVDDGPKAGPDIVAKLEEALGTENPHVS